MFYFDPYIILLIPIFILALYAQNLVKGRYNHYKKIRNSNNLTGGEIAKKILERNSLSDVEVVPVSGVLSDHYDPRKRVVKLSEEVYHGRSVAAMSIAAHEVGHAIQHAKNYVPLTIRSSVFPIASFGSQMALPMFLIGFLFGTGFLMDLGILLFGGALLFHLVTLPVEFNASFRAIGELSGGGIVVRQDEVKGTKAVLKAAALTYVASTLMALVHFLRLIFLRGMRQ